MTRSPVTGVSEAFAGVWRRELESSSDEYEGEVKLPGQLITEVGEGGDEVCASEEIGADKDVVIITPLFGASLDLLF